MRFESAGSTASDVTRPETIVSLPEMSYPTCPCTTQDGPSGLQPNGSIDGSASLLVFVDRSQAEPALARLDGVLVQHGVPRRVHDRIVRPAIHVCAVVPAP